MLAAIMVPGIIDFLIIFVLIFLVIAILYLLNLQNTLKAAAPENRKMKPGMVWLLLIPVFNYFWMFVVASKISDTIKDEYASKGQNPGVARPTYNLGLANAVLGLVSLGLTSFNLPNTISTFESGAIPTPNPVFSMISNVLSLALLIIWIAYWVQTAGFKNKMKMLPSANKDSEIFRGL